MSICVRGEQRKRGGRIKAHGWFCTARIRVNNFSTHLSLKFAWVSLFFFSEESQITDVETTSQLSQRKRSRQTSWVMFSHNPIIIITKPEPGKKTRGRTLKERSIPAEGCDSAIVCHLAANKTCSRRYKVRDFSVLTRARTNNHLNVLEAVYIRVLNPVLCKQKSFVTSLTLFQRTKRTNPR